MMENKSQVPFTKNVQIGDQPKAKAALDQNRVKINLDANERLRETPSKIFYILE